MILTPNIWTVLYFCKEAQCIKWLFTKIFRLTIIKVTFLCIDSSSFFFLNHWILTLTIIDLKTAEIHCFKPHISLGEQWNNISGGDSCHVWEGSWCRMWAGHCRLHIWHLHSLPYYYWRSVRQAWVCSLIYRYVKIV